MTAHIYTGKEENGIVHRNLATDVVLELASPFFGTGREIVTDRYFTSHDLAVQLSEKKLSLLGTIKANRKEIPSQLRNVRDRQVHSTKAFYDHQNKIVIASHVPKKFKNVLMLSSSDSEVRESDREDKKPDIILRYKCTKGGVDVMDACLEEFTTRRKTCRWPLLINFNMIDVGWNNAFLLMKKMDTF